MRIHFRIRIAFANQVKMIASHRSIANSLVRIRIANSRFRIRIAQWHSLFWRQVCMRLYQ